MTFKIPRKLGRTGRSVVVRPLETRDYDAWFKGQSAIGKQRNEWDRSGPPPEKLTRLEFRKLIAVHKERRDRDWLYDFGIFRKSDGVYMGHVGLMEVSRGVAQTAFLGYRLLNPFWGNGYASEAVKLAFELGFKDLGLHRIEAGIEPGNRRSIQLARKLGMRCEGMKKRMLFLRGKWVDLRMFTLTTEDLGWRYRGPEPKLLQR